MADATGGWVVFSKAVCKAEPAPGLTGGQRHSGLHGSIYGVSDKILPNLFLPYRQYLIKITDQRIPDVPGDRFNNLVVYLVIDAGGQGGPFAQRLYHRITEFEPQKMHG